jgi:hypothetical protein
MPGLILLARPYIDHNDFSAPGALQKLRATDWLHTIDAAEIVTNQAVQLRQSLFG